VVDPLSVAGIATFLTALNQGVATEAGRAVGDGAGELLRRCLGRPVRVPTVSAEILEMARILHAAGLGCGQLVDTAVHAFILDTGNYAAFCDRYHGRFLHHIPEIDRKADGTVARTAQIILGNGFTIDWPLWEHDYTKCSPCRPGENCH